MKNSEFRVYCRIQLGQVIMSLITDVKRTHAHVKRAQNVLMVNIRELAMGFKG